MKSVFSASVREVVELVLQSGDLDLATFSKSYTQDPIRIHQIIQSRRPEEYTAEVPVSRSIEGDDFVLNLGGRIDGVYVYPDRTVIDEIKTTTLDPDAAARAKKAVHWGQVKCYAYMYACEHSLDTITVQLTYYGMESRKTVEVHEDCTRTELERFINDLVVRYIEWVKIREAWKEKRDHSIREMEFPFKNCRTGQQTMMDEVLRGIVNSKQVFVQAPTGIGKTIAALYPAIKTMPDNGTDKVFFLTARTTGRIVAEKALSELRTGSLRLRSLTLTAKERICACPDCTCTPSECTYAKGHYDRLPGAIKEALDYDSLTQPTISILSKKHRVCPFEFSLDLSLWCDCIICDYNYAFDPRVYLRRFFTDVKNPFVLLIDEAHNLVDRSRDMFSAELDKQEILKTRRLIKEKLPDVYNSLGKINTGMLTLLKECDEHNGAYYDQEPPAALYDDLTNFTHAARRWLAKNHKTLFRQNLIELFFKINNFLLISELYDSHYVTCYTTDNKNLKIKLYCIDPSTLMQAAWARCKSLVFFSATLVPMAYFIRILGCDPDARKVVLTSPFPRENLTVITASRISTLYKAREATKAAVTEMLITLAESKQGNYLFYFPSYAYLDLIYRHFTETNTAVQTIRQERDFSEKDRSDFLDLFHNERNDSLVGFAVMGGIFGEGIDLVGDRLTGVAVVGVGLPGISPERDSIRDYFNRSDRKGFEFAYQYPGMNKVLQAAGRVIRTENDRGIVLLIDRRFFGGEYQALMPAEWNRGFVVSAGQLAAQLNQFWDRKTTNIGKENDE